MTLPKSIEDREYKKFAEVSSEVAVRVTGILGSGLAPVTYDRVDVAYPTSATEVYTFKLSNVSVGVVTVTYEDDSKENLLSAVRT